MGYAHDVLSLVADELEGVDTMGFSVTDNKDGTSTIKGRFRVKPRKKDADAMDADIEPLKVKPTVKAKFSDCKAINPMRCRYHGAMYATQQLKSLCDMLGVDGDSIAVKRIDTGTYDFSVKIPSSKIGEFKKWYGDFLSDNDLVDLGSSKEDGHYDFLYESEEELDPDEVEAVDGLKTDLENAKKSIDELSGLKSSLSPDDLSALNEELAGQQSRIEEMNDAVEMLGANDDFEDEGDETENVDVNNGSIPVLPKLPDSLDELSLIESDIGGSTAPTLWQDKNGNKFVMKTGGTAGGDPEAHVTNEYNGLKAYRAMGVFAPDAKLYKDKDGNTVMVENFVEGTPLGQFLEGATAKQEKNIRKQIQDTSFADIVLGNWDCAGTDDATVGSYPNMLVVNGQICRIDPGGWGRYRATGGLKKDSEWKDGNPDDLFSMKRIGTSAEFLKDMSYYDLTQQIDSKDYTALLDAVPNEDKAVLKKRIDAIRKLAARGRNYVEDGQYENKEFVDNVLEISYEAEKNGAAESLSYGSFTFDSLGEDSMEHGAVQNNNSPELDKINYEIIKKKSELKTLESGSSLKFSQIKKDIIYAIDYASDFVNHKNDGLNIEDFFGDVTKEEAKLQHVKKELKKMIAALSPQDGDDELGLFASFSEDSIKVSEKKIAFIDAALKAIGKFKEFEKNWKDGNLKEVDFDYANEKDFVLDLTSAEDEFPIGVDGKTQKEIDNRKKEVEDLEKKAMALQKKSGKLLVGKSPIEIIDFMSKEFGKRNNAPTASYLDLYEMFIAQGFEVWPGDDRQFDSGHLMKICELDAMGVGLNEKPIIEETYETDENAGMNYLYSPQYLKTPSGRLIYAGSWSYEKKSGGKKGEKDYTNSSARVFNDTLHYVRQSPSDHKARMIAFAAMKAVQSLIFENTKFQGATKTHVAVTRTVPEYISTHYGLQRGKYNFYPAGTSESSAYGAVTTVMSGQDAVQLRVPVSRLTGMYCWGNTYQAYGEKEFGVNTVGLPLYCQSRIKVKSEFDSGKPFTSFAVFSSKNPEVTSENSYTYEMNHT